MALLLVGWVVAELLVAALVADAIGIPETLLALVACSLLGSVVALAAGRDAFASVSAQVARGRMPGRELLDGAVVLAGGVLLVLPGFLSATLGLLLLFPPTRIGVRRIVERRIRRRLGGTDRPGDDRPDDVIDV